MANAILTSPLNGTPLVPGMPIQALVAILTNGTYQLTYERNFDNLAPSLASAIQAGADLIANDLTQSILQTSTTVDFNDDSASQSLFTVPAGFQFIPYRIVIRNASASLTTASVSFGFNNPDYNDVIADSTYTELTGPTLDTTLFPKAGAAVGNAADVFSMLVNTAEGSAATGVIDVLGYLVVV